MEAVRLIEWGPFRARETSSGPSLMSRFALGENTSPRNPAESISDAGAGLPAGKPCPNALLRPQSKWANLGQNKKLCQQLSRLPWDALLMNGGHVDVELCMLPMECPHLRFLSENDLEFLTGCIASTLYFGS